MTEPKKGTTPYTNEIHWPNYSGEQCQHRILTSAGDLDAGGECIDCGEWVVRDQGEER